MTHLPSVKDPVMKSRILCSVLTLVAVCSLVAVAADWPQWRGPQRDGKSEEKGLLQEWPADGPALLWQIKDIGEGYSTPAVVGNMLFVQCNEGMDNEFVQAIDVEKGEKTWAQRLGKVGPNVGGPNYPGTRSTPTVEGDLLYALGSDGDLACLRTTNGEVVWTKSLRTDFGGTPGKWAYSESPLIDGDVLVCTPGGSDATIVALNKKTGETIWKSQIPEGDKAAYSSVIITEVDGLKQYVQFLENGLVEYEEGRQTYRTTEKGIRLVQIYNHMSDELVISNNIR
jgi:outer membrane protein assembly factor BamB